MRSGSSDSSKPTGASTITAKEKNPARRALSALPVLLILAGGGCSGGGETTLTGAMASPRHGHTATALPDGRLVVAAGLTKTSPLGAVELFDPKKNAFEAVAGLKVRPRGWHRATSLQDGRVLLSGGWAGPSKALRDAVAIQPDGRAAPPVLMLQGRYDHTATLLGDGTVLLAGGNDGRGEQRAMEIFDPRAGRFLPTARPLLVPRQLHTATLLPGGEVLILGGAQGDGARIAELYLPAERRTRLVRGYAAAARSRHTATRLPDGRVLIAGGLGPDRTLDTAELFDHRRGAFLPVKARMRTARQQHTATLLPDGRVVLLGGWGGREGRTLDDGEVFDPAGACFASLPVHMRAKRRLHTATLLAGGGVLAAGGATDDEVLATAEILRVPPRKPGGGC